MTTEAATRKGPARVAVQRFGTNLSNLVMPNIGAFIAWGLITALFMRSGWINAVSYTHLDVYKRQVSDLTTSPL